MSMLTSPTATVANPRSGALRNLPTAVAFLLAVVGAVLVGALGTTVIAAIAHGVGVSHSFTPLHPGTYIAFIVLGVLGGAVGWQLVRAKAYQPASSSGLWCLLW